MIRLADARIPESGIEAVNRVLRSGHLIAGAENAALEEEMADYIGSADVVLVSSGTAALHIACLALDLGPGDAVLVPDFTFPATANAVAICGATPVLVDVEPATYNLSPDRLEEAIREWQGPERLAAVIPVHEFGRCADMPAILGIARRHRLAVIEDAACALGARVGDQMAGSMGDVGCFSFHPRKSMTTGEGGAVSTSSPELAQRLRLLRNHGMRRVDGHVVFETVGLNYRLTEFQAALGRVQLGLLPDAIGVRRSIAHAYADLLGALVGRGVRAVPDASVGHAWQTYMLVLDAPVDRLRVIDALRNRGVEANLGAQSLSELGLYAAHARQLQVGRELYRHGLALPCHQGMTEADVASVAAGLSAALDELRAG